MPTHTINSSQQGVYEIPVPANTVVTVAAASTYPWIVPQLTVMVLNGDSPVYAKSGNTVTQKDPEATIVTTGTWSTVDVAYTGTVAVISATPAVVSVYR